MLNTFGKSLDHGPCHNVKSNYATDWTQPICISGIKYMYMYDVFFSFLFPRVFMKTLDSQKIHKQGVLIVHVYVNYLYMYVKIIHVFQSSIYMYMYLIFFLLFQTHFPEFISRLILIKFSLSEAECVFFFPTILSILLFWKINLFT